MSGYTLLKYVHVVLAIIAVGFNISYAAWIARATREPGHTSYALRGVKMLDDRFANPAYGLLLVTGILLVWIGDLDFGALWISASLGLYVVTVLVAVLGFTPTLRRLIAIADASGPDSPEYAAGRRRAMTLGGVATLLVLTIEFLMVNKPA